MPSATLSVRTNLDLRRKLDQRAKKLKTNRNALINTLLEESLKRAEKEERSAKLRADALRIAESDKTNPDVAYWNRVIEDAVEDIWAEIEPAEIRRP